MSTSGPPPIIIGAGPCGALAAALFADQNMKPILIEKSPDPARFTLSRTHTQMVFFRGRRVLSRVPGLHAAVETQAKSIMSRRAIIIPPKGDQFNLKRATPTPDGKPDIRLLRSVLTGCLNDFLKDVDVDARYGTALENLEFHPDGSITVHVVRDGQRDTLKTRMVVACDGANSTVLQQLRSAPSHLVTSSHGFDDDTYTSPSVGLNRKTLLIDGNFDVPSDELLTPHAYMPTPGRPPLRSFILHTFPLRKEDVGTIGGAIASVVRPADHAVWRLQTVEEAYAFFDENVPQFRVRERVSEESMHRFVTARPNAFPVIRRTRSLVAHVGTQSDTGGVVLLGDAAHSFPPDLGQGVNAAFEDAAVLIDAFSEGGTLGHTLRRYEAMRDDDTSALMHLMRYGAPYQYGQSTLGSKLAQYNFRLRQELASRFEGFHPACAYLTVSDRSYSEAWRMATDTTRKIYRAVVAGVAVPLLGVLVYKWRGRAASTR